MDVYVDLQIATQDDLSIPELSDIQKWVSLAISTSITTQRDEAELTIRIVEIDESQQLNSDYRGKDKPTNVLSFPFQNPPGITLPLLGDLVICKAVVEKESAEQHKILQAHWAHMIIHGTLHLLGYDHIIEKEAVEMENLETEILVKLGFPAPYNEQE